MTTMTNASVKNMFAVLSVLILSVGLSMGAFVIVAHADGEDLGYADLYGDNLGYADLYGDNLGNAEFYGDYDYVYDEGVAYSERSYSSPSYSQPSYSQPFSFRAPST